MGRERAYHIHARTKMKPGKQLRCIFISTGCEYTERTFLKTSCANFLHFPPQQRVLPVHSTVGLSMPLSLSSLRGAVRGAAVSPDRARRLNAKHGGI